VLGKSANSRAAREAKKDLGAQLDFVFLKVEHHFLPVFNVFRDTDQKNTKKAKSSDSSLVPERFLNHRQEIRKLLQNLNRRTSPSIQNIRAVTLNLEVQPILNWGGQAWESGVGKVGGVGGFWLGVWAGHGL